MALRSRPRLLSALVALGVTSGCLSGCIAPDLQFRADKRLTIQSPKAGDRVTPPFTLRWRMRDFAATGATGSTGRNSGSFAVFVDRPPMRAGTDLRSLMKDPTCATRPSCPTAQELADHRVYVTTSTSLHLERLPVIAATAGHEEHGITIVLLDGNNRRIGESAWFVSFTTARRLI